MSQLPDDLRALAADQPEVADWPRLVAQTIRVRRRRALLGSAVALVLVAGTGVTAVLAGDRSSTVTLDTATPPSPSPSPAASPSVGPTPTPEPSPAPAPVDTPSPTQRPAAPVATGTPAPEAPPAGPTYPPGRNVISFEITVSPARPRVGEQVTITVVARGDKARPYFRDFTLERAQQAKTYPAFSCAPAEPAPPQPGESRDSMTFAYEEAGPETVTVSAESGCSYYEGSASDERTFVVDPAPEPSPTAS